jgi:hypothetical protein
MEIYFTVTGANFFQFQFSFPFPAEHNREGNLNFKKDETEKINEKRVFYLT